MLLKNLEGADSIEVDQFKYEERAEEFLRLKKTKLDTSMQEERKSDSKSKNNSSLSFEKEINTKYSRRDNISSPMKNVSNEFDNEDEG
jgi:uncharacterized alpha-E superfamily protein